MSVFYEFHAIQSFPLSSLNCDDIAEPKWVTYGGSRRGHISSQCQKRSIRLSPEFSAATAMPLAICTRQAARRVAEVVGDDSESTLIAAEKLVKSLTTDKNGGETLVYIAPDEIEELAELVRVGDTEISAGYTQKFSGRTSAPDLAMFGRITANAPSLTLPAACQVAHAFTTHRIAMETDDSATAKGETGTGYLDIGTFNLSTFYRYARVDLDQLIANLGGDREMAAKSLRGFAEAFAVAVPSGKSNATVPFTPPTLVVAVRRTGGPALNCAVAFETPIRSTEGYVGPSVTAFARHFTLLAYTYAGYTVAAVSALSALPELTYDLTEDRVETLNDWLATVVL